MKKVLILCFLYSGIFALTQGVSADAIARLKSHLHLKNQTLPDTLSGLFHLLSVLLFAEGMAEKFNRDRFLVYLATRD